MVIAGVAGFALLMIWVCGMISIGVTWGIRNYYKEVEKEATIAKEEKKK